jgi:hypothetical protein
MIPFDVPVRPFIGSAGPAVSHDGGEGRAGFTFGTGLVRFGGGSVRLKDTSGCCPVAAMYAPHAALRIVTTRNVIESTIPAIAVPRR